MKRVVSKRLLKKPEKFGTFLLFEGLSIIANLLVAKGYKDYNIYVDHPDDYKMYNHFFQNKFYSSKELDELDDKINDQDTDLLTKILLYIDRLRSGQNVKVNINEEDLEKVLEEEKVEYLRIINPQLMNSYDVTVINNSDVKHVDLVFNYDGLSDITEIGFDVSRFEKDTSIINIADTEEVQRVQFLNYLHNYSDNQIYEDERIFESRDAINQMYQEVGIKDDDLTVTKIFKIISYLSYIIDYDPQVSAKDTNTDPNVVEEVANYYHQYNVSSITTNNNEVKLGTCDNYASLFCLLAQKAGIPTRKVNGHNKIISECHAFNLVEYNGTEYIIDVTTLDNSINDLLYEYRTTKNEERKTEIHNYIFDYVFVPVETYENIYDFQNNKEDYFKDNRKLVEEREPSLSDIQYGYEYDRYFYSYLAIALGVHCSTFMFEAIKSFGRNKEKEKSTRIHP